MSLNILFFHSILRYLVLLFAVIVVLQSLMGMLGKKQFKKPNKMTALALMIVCDIQLLLGFAVYFMNGWLDRVKGMSAITDPDAKHVTMFFGMEHSVTMLIVIVLIHIGYSNIKKNIDDDRKFKRLFWYTLIALILCIAMIPWPGKKYAGRPLIPATTFVNVIPGNTANI